MKQMMMCVIAAMLLAAGGVARAAEKETPIDWPARAATVKVGMTRAEVEKILQESKTAAGGVEAGACAGCKAASGREKYYWEADVSRKLLNGVDLRNYFAGVGTNIVVMWDTIAFSGVIIPKGKWLGRTEVYWVAEDWAVMVHYDQTGDAWNHPQNRVCGPVQIKKLKKPVAPKPKP